MKKALALLTMAACLLIYLTSCNKTNSVAPSYVRVFTIDPTLKPQDIYINNQAQLSGVAYGNYNNQFAIAPGTYHIGFTNTGSSTSNSDYNIDFNAGKNYLMYLLNNNDTMQAEAFDESVPRLGLDTTAIRFFNFSHDAPLMDIGVKNADTSKLDTTYTFYTKRYFNDVYQNSAYTKFIVMPAGSYYIKLRYADTTIAFDSVLLSFAVRHAYTIVAHGTYNGPTTTPFKVDTLMH